MIKHAATQTTLCVLIPAGCDLLPRSMPITIPAIKDNAIRIKISVFVNSIPDVTIIIF